MILARNVALQTEVRRLKVEAIAAQAEHTEFVQYVATLLPEAVKKDDPHPVNYQLRTLASVAVPGKPLKVETSSSLFETGKSLFRNRSFREANIIFDKLITQYPDSVHALEARFLLLEGRYQTGDLENSLAVVEEMVSLFPEHVLTGVAVLRMAGIFEAQDRLEDAAETYKTVLRAFNDAQLRSQAEKSIREIAL